MNIFLSTQEVFTRRDFLQKACSDKAMEKAFKLKKSRFRLDTRKRFFTVRVVRYWNRLPRGIVDAPPVAFKASLDGALIKLVWSKVSLPIAGGLELDDLSTK